MRLAIAIKDWLYVALVAAALITYALSLISKGFAAESRVADACVFSDATVKVN
jgi:hypothetical protein